MDSDLDFDEFAAELVSRLSAKMPDKHVKLDSSGHLIRHDNARIGLASLFRMYQETPVEMRQQEMDRFVDILCQANQYFESPESEVFADIAPQIHAKLWPRSIIAVQQLPIPFCLIGEHLVLSIVRDLGDSMATVSWDNIHQWGVTFEAALKVGLENVDKNTSLMGNKRKDGPGHCSTATRDNYDSVRFLTEKPYEQFRIGFPRWAFAPSRDACVMAQADMTNDLEFEVENVLEMADGDPKPLAPFPLVNYGKGWEIWNPEPGTKIAKLLSKRQHDYKMSLYAEQLLHLRASSPERLDFVAIEHLEYDEANSCGDLFRTKTHWEYQSETLLPQADSVVFLGRDGLTVSWTNLVEILDGHLSPAENLYPPRWRTSGLLSDAEFAKLAAIGIHPK